MVRYSCRHLTTDVVVFHGFPQNTRRYACPAAPCYFPASQTLSVPVLAVRSETHNSKVITFGLPAGREAADLHSNVVRWLLLDCCWQCVHVCERESKLQGFLLLLLLLFLSIPHSPGNVCAVCDKAPL